jgi:hypothetical protein
MVSITDLPQIAVQQIVRRARGRSIAGTNKYARVCRQWRAAEDEAEPLQLFMNLAHLSEEDLARVTSWLSMHGQSVDVLVAPVVESPCVDNLGWLVGSAPALRNLQRLEVPGHDLLEQLVPVLKQLPQLQHLEASVQVKQHLAGSTRAAKAKQAPRQQVPNLRKLCPDLISLRLMVNPAGAAINLDDRVAHLFSPGLQQLALTSRSKFRVSLCASGVGHLSALQQLTLDGVVVDKQGACKLAQELGAVQQLRVYYLQCGEAGPGCLAAGVPVHLFPNLTEYEMWSSDWERAAWYNEDVLASCGHLTRLVLGAHVPEGTADALAALTGLRELGVYSFFPGRNEVVVQHAAGMAQLRSLQLEGHSVSQVMGANLAQCTQLTSLVLLSGYKHRPDSNQISASTLQQLAGLRCLTVHEEMVLVEQGTWLLALTQLTRLCVNLAGYVSMEGDSGLMLRLPIQWPERRRAGYHAAAQRVLAQVQQWPAGLQQIVFSAEYGRYGDSFQPMCWQLPSAGVGKAQVAVWLEEQYRLATTWSRPFRPCPHLPGVWELQGAAAGRPWHLVKP